MAYINVGVEGAASKSKKALKEAVKADPGGVVFYCTSPLGEQFNGSADQIPAGVRLSVVGPDPYARRNWYATVERTANGIKVS